MMMPPALTLVWVFRLGPRPGASLWLLLSGCSPALTVVFTCMKRSPLLQRTRQRRAGHATAAPPAGMGLGGACLHAAARPLTMSIPTAPGIGQKNQGRAE